MGNGITSNIGNVRTRFQGSELVENAYVIFTYHFQGQMPLCLYASMPPTPKNAAVPVICPLCPSICHHSLASSIYTTTTTIHYHAIIHDEIDCPQRCFAQISRHPIMSSSIQPRRCLAHTRYIEMDCPQRCLAQTRKLSACV